MEEPPPFARRTSSRLLPKPTMVIPVGDFGESGCEEDGAFIVEEGGESKCESESTHSAVASMTFFSSRFFALFSRFKEMLLCNCRFSCCSFVSLVCLCIFFPSHYRFPPLFYFLSSSGFTFPRFLCSQFSRLLVLLVLDRLLYVALVLHLILMLLFSSLIFSAESLTSVVA